MSKRRRRARLRCTLWVQLKLVVCLAGLTLQGVPAQTSAQLQSYDIGPWPAARGIVVTDSSAIRPQPINNAAKALTQKGARVLVLFFEGLIGQDYADVDAFLDAALLEYGLMADEHEVVDHALTLLVGTNPLVRSQGEKPAFIDYGGAYYAVLSQPVGPDYTKANSIREEVMIPYLQEGDFTQAIVKTLEALVPLLPATGTSAPTALQNPRSGFIGWWWFIIIGLLLGCFLLQRRTSTSSTGRTTSATNPVQQKTAYEQQQRTLRTLKEKLSTLLIELDSAEDGVLALPADADQHTDLVLITSLAAQDRTELVTALRRAYGPAREQLEQVAEAFTTTSHTEATYTKPTADQLSQLISAYQAQYHTATQASDYAQKLADTWQTLQKEAADVPQKLAETEAYLQEVRQQVLTAEGEQAIISTITPLATEINSARTALEHDRPLKASTLLHEAKQDMVRVLQKTHKRAELRRDGPKRLAQLERAYKETIQRLPAAKASFDRLKEQYALNNWRDIEGNGSRAEMLLAEVAALHTQAEALQHRDKVIVASEYIEDSLVKLTQASELLHAVEEREKELHDIQRRAQKELHAVLQELDETRFSLDTLQSPPLSLKGYTQRLTDFETQLRVARDMTHAPHPDWLGFIRDVQHVDRALDEVREAIETFQEQLAAQKRLTESEKQEAHTALSAFQHYLRAHPAVRQAPYSHVLKQAERDYRDITAQLSRVTSKRGISKDDDGDGLITLKELAGRYEGLEQMLITHQQQAQSDQLRAETLAKRARNELTHAQHALDQLALYTQHAKKNSVHYQHLMQQRPDPHVIDTLTLDGLETFLQTAEAYKHQVTHALKLAQPPLSTPQTRIPSGPYTRTRHSHGWPPIKPPQAPRVPRRGTTIPRTTRSRGAHTQPRQPIRPLSGARHPQQNPTFSRSFGQKSSQTRRKGGRVRGGW